MSSRKKNTGHFHPPVSPYADSVILFKTIKPWLLVNIKISGPNRGLLFMRFILSKFFRGLEPTDYDYVCLAQLLDYFSMSQNYTWFKDHELDFLTTRNAARIIVQLHNRLPSVAEVNQLRIFRSRVVLNPREFLGLFNAFRTEDFIQVENLKIKKKKKQKRFIGVGYRDKGNTQIPSRDGSPHWKEVAAQDPFDVEEKARRLARIPEGYPAWALTEEDSRLLFCYSSEYLAHIRHIQILQERKRRQREWTLIFFIS